MHAMLNKLSQYIFILLTALLLTSCSVKENDTVQTVKVSDISTVSTSMEAIASGTQKTITEAPNEEKPQQVIKSWEEYEASPRPLVAAIPEKDIFLYDIKGEKEPRVLLKAGDFEQYFDWICLTPRFILPKIQLTDLDADGKEELTVILYVGSGTGVSLQELHVLELPERKQDAGESLKDRVFGDYINQLDKVVSLNLLPESNGLKGEIWVQNKKYKINLEDYQSEEYGKMIRKLFYGNIVYFSMDNNNLMVELAAGLGFENIAGPVYIGGTLNADIDYKAGEFKLKNIRYVKD